jgi:hypothetical protein
MPMTTIRCGAVTVLVAGLLWTSAALAQGKGEAVAVVVEGSDADAVAGWIEDRVRAPDVLHDGDVLRAALRSRGALPLRGAASNGWRDAQLVARARTAASVVGVDRAILVDLHRTPRGTYVHVWTIDPHEPTAGVDTELTLSPRATVIDETRAVLGLLPRPTEPAAASESKDGPVAPPPDGRADPAPTIPEPDRGAAAPASPGDGALLSAQAALGVGMRHFSYVQRVTPTLRPYDLGAAPLAALSAAVYPLSFTGVPVLRDLGLTGEYARAFAVSSEDSAGTSVGTTWQSFDVAATERIALGRAVLVNVSLGYGGDDFQFDQTLSGATAALPSVAYRFVRAGADVHVTFLSAFTAFAGGSYLDILDSGYTAQLFPRESVGGVEGHLGASYDLTKRWQASVSAAYTRFFYSVNPVPGDTTVAGGALDEQTRVLAALAYRM